MICAICKFLRWLFECECRPRRRSTYIQFYSRRRRLNLYMQLKANKKLPLSVKAADKFGNATEASFDAPPSYALSDESILSLEVAEDGLSAMAMPKGVLGECLVEVTGVVEGKEVKGELLIEVTAGDVASVALIAGEPEEA